MTRLTFLTVQLVYRRHLPIAEGSVVLAVVASLIFTTGAVNLFRLAHGAGRLTTGELPFFLFWICGGRLTLER
jgi:hypothetical protein